MAAALLLGLTAPGFLSVDNVRNLAVQVPVNTIIAVGMTPVILTGGIDLSVGSIHALVGVLTALALTHPGFAETLGPLAVPGSLLIGLLVGAGVGAFNGLAIARFGLPPFIVTLATMRIGRGLAKQATNGLPVGLVEETAPRAEQLNQHWEAIQPLGLGDASGVPVPLLLALGLAVAVWLLLAHTAFGRAVYAVGSNEEAARLAGLRPPRVKGIVYTLCGLLAAGAGIVEAAQLQSGSPIAGEGYELAAIAAVVVGGTRLTGGQGGVPGTVIGAVFVIGVMNNALNLYNVPAFWQEAATGAIIFGIVLLDQLARRRERAAA